ncbi:endoglin [Carettochelys insculpta]|uniref:endoglin n=1 Tax=Carettochelys insculpta TaxID=44489 RepID=UPI003EBD1EFC
MEAGLFLAVLLLSCTPSHTSPMMSAGDCTHLPSSRDMVSYLTGKALSGCVSRSSMAGQREIHVLQLKMKEQTLQLSVSSSERTTPQKRPVLFVLFCDKPCIVKVHSEELTVDFALNNNSQIYRLTGNGSAFNEGANYAGDKPLVQEVKDRYRSITSFTELENPHHIRFQVGEDASSPEDCIVQPGFNAQRYLQTEFLVQKAKHCRRPRAQMLKEAHILRVQQGPEETSSQSVEVKVNVVCSEAKPLQDLQLLLILPSKDNMTWDIDVRGIMSILTPGSYRLTTFPSAKINGTAIPDNEKDLIDLAHQKGYGDITSYMDIPSATNVTLDLHRCASEVTTLPPTSPTVNVDITHQYFSLTPVWKCTDDTIELSVSKMSLKPLKQHITDITLQDPRCKAEQNATYFVLKRYLGDCHTTLENGGLHATNKLILTRAAPLQMVEVSFTCKLPQELQLQLYQTQDFKWPPTPMLQVNKSAYVQVSLRPAESQKQLTLKECSLQTAANKPGQLLFRPNAANGQQVTIRKPTKATLGRELHQFSIVYNPAGVGPVPPCATLVCTISTSPNGSTIEEVSLEVKLQEAHPPSPTTGLGIEAVVGITFAAFLIGTLLTAALWCIYSHTRPLAQMQPVSTTVPASESSSTNHSIGSTQSTPCSTSSTA